MLTPRTSSVTILLPKEAAVSVTSSAGFEPGSGIAVPTQVVLTVCDNTYHAKCFPCGLGDALYSSRRAALALVTRKVAGGRMMSMPTTGNKVATECSSRVASCLALGLLVIVLAYAADLSLRQSIVLAILFGLYE